MMVEILRPCERDGACHPDCNQFRTTECIEKYPVLGDAPFIWRIAYLEARVAELEGQLATVHITPVPEYRVGTAGGYPLVARRDGVYMERPQDAPEPARLPEFNCHSCGEAIPGKPIMIGTRGHIYCAGCVKKNNLSPVASNEPRSEVEE